MVEFFIIWSGQAVSLLGSRLVQFGLVWWLTETTESATVLATATLVALLPGVFIGPFAGALVDRWNRRWVMIIADGVIALATVGLALLFYFGVARPWHVYVVMFIRATAGGFHWPAMRASTSLMVPEKHLARVEGMNQTLGGMLSILAPPLGAFLLEVLPLQGVLGIDVATAALAIAPLLFISIPQPKRAVPAEAEAERISLGRDVLDGLRYVWNWPGLFLVLLMAMGVNFLFNPAFSLLPLLVKQHFGGDALELGWLQSASGVGVILGGLVLSAWGGFKRRIMTSMMGLIGLGIGVVTLGVAPSALFWLGLGAMFFMGFMNPLVNGPLLALVQARVTPEMQGRVFTLIQSGSTAMSPLGLAVAGPVADWLGIQTWYVIGGAVCTLMGVAAFFVPAIIHIEENHKGHTAPEAQELGGEAIPSYAE